jgi:3D-(3,5/4)-trihydroxycyclohexane-1,2-dione acylhydrolase (decyclizing)
MTQGDVYAVLNAAAEPGDWVVAAAGWAPGDLLKVWRVPPAGSAHLEFGYSCMGHEIPAALGIRLHDGPGAEIVVVIGDGTFLMAPSELVTAAQEDLKITVVLLDNSGYGSIDQLALTKTSVSVGNRFERRDGTPVAVDYAAAAESFGCRGLRADDAAALGRALAEARAGDATTVIHCPTVPRRPLLDSGAFWDLGVPETARDASVREPAERHLRERADRQRRL